MKHIKSERLKKLETELSDLEQWLKLGLVPKRDIPKHKEEIQAILTKIEEENERLQFLRDSGEAEEYVTPKKGQTRAGYTEMPTIPDIDNAVTAHGGFQETTEAAGNETADNETTSSDEPDKDTGEATLVEEDEESYFSDRNRWKRSGSIIDPDADEW